MVLSNDHNITMMFLLVMCKSCKMQQHTTEATDSSINKLQIKETILNKKKPAINNWIKLNECQQLL
uniref:Uncharacterized protein n=1 Tax=Octopus bimaculoides TaxID=37653 RepID=A0A0L8HJJ1_OCTBM